jgi:hypothetical protein
MKHSILNISKEKIDSINEKIIEELGEVLIDIRNPVLLILQAHLYIESLLDRFISAELPKGEVLVTKGNLTFFQKVALANSFSIIDEQIIDGLFKLNGIRNDLAHKFQHEITASQVESLGRILGKDYTNIKNTSNGCLVKQVILIVNFIASCVATNTFMSEQHGEKS